MPDIDPNCKELARGGEELLLMVVGLFFIGGEIDICHQWRSGTVLH